MGGEFYSSCWDVVTDDVLKVFANFHKNGKMCKGMNSTFVTLIPKFVNLANISDFRPISLVNSIYKIIAKALANRLGKFLDKVISENQLAFIGERNILDGVLITNQIIDEGKKKKKSLFMFKIVFERLMIR